MSRSEWTEFEIKAERIVIEETERMLNKIDDLASSLGATVEDVSDVLHRFAGDEVEDIWNDLVAEGETFTQPTGGPR